MFPSLPRELAAYGHPGYGVKFAKAVKAELARRYALREFQHFPPARKSAAVHAAVYAVRDGWVVA